MLHVPEADVAFISGTTGAFALEINGLYFCTPEISEGYPVYRKCDDSGFLMEHRRGCWQVKPGHSKDSDASLAYIAGGCALEDCTSRIWTVYDGGWTEAPSVKMVTGAEAMRQVSGSCLLAHECALLLLCVLRTYLL
jgi:hypothetical protein